MDVRNLVGSTRLTVRSTLRCVVLKVVLFARPLESYKINPIRHDARVTVCKKSCVKFF